MTIPIETLKEVGVIFTHKNCPDGMATAMILKDAFRMLGMAPRIEFLAHNTPEHKGAIDRHYLHSGNTRALFCDIAPHPDVYRDHVVAGDIVLDHHKGAEELVRAFGALGVFADEKLEPGISGAALAWREVWEVANEETLPRGLPPLERANAQKTVMGFALDTGARDTWQTTSKRFQRGQWISKMIMSKPVDYWLAGDPLHPNPSLAPHLPYLTEEEVHAGRALFEAHEEAVRQAVAQCVHFDIGTARLIVFQEQASGFRLCSDVAEGLRQNWRGGDPWAVIAGFSYVVNKPGESPVVVYSLRGLNGFDVAAFAKANGGGGHTAAAGFSLPAEELDAKGPYAHISIRLREFLQAR